MSDLVHDDNEGKWSADTLPVDMTHFPTPGNYIGPYKILVTLGEGGFGIVYLAEQENPYAGKWP